MHSLNEEVRVSSRESCCTRDRMTNKFAKTGLVTTNIPDDYIPEPELYTVVHEQAYDLTEYCDKHPGGKSMLQLADRRDATALFESYHSHCDFDIIENIQKTTMIPTPTDFNNDKLPEYDYDDPFFIEFKQRVREYFHHDRRNAKATYKKYAVRLSELLVFCYASYHFLNGEWWTLPIIGTFFWLVGTGCLHDGTHETTTDNHIVNYMSGLVGSLHMDPATWSHSHLIGHHLYPNIPPFDVDSEYIGYYKRYNAWLRNLIKIPITAVWCGIYEGYTFQIVGTWPRWEQPKQDSKFNFLWKSKKMSFFIPNVIRFVVMYFTFVKPFLSFHPLKAFCFTVIPNIIHSAWVWHWTMPVHHRKKEDRISWKEGTSWGKWQTEQTFDVSPTSLFTNWISIGTNNQCLHHLLPGVDPCHFPYLAPFLEELCKKYDINYKFHANPFAMYYYFYTSQDAVGPLKAHEE